MGKFTPGETVLLNSIERLIKRKQKPNGLRRSLAYLYAIYLNGEGKIVEKKLREHIEGIRDFKKEMNDENGRVINIPSSRAQ